MCPRRREEPGTDDDEASARSTVPGGRRRKRRLPWLVPEDLVVEFDETGQRVLRGESHGFFLLS